MQVKNFTAIGCILLVFLSFNASSFSEEKSASKKPGILQDIIIIKQQDFLEVKILFSPETFRRRFELTDPNRIVVNLLNTVDIQTSRYFEVNDFGIRAIRTGMFKKDVARVVFDVEEKMPSYEIQDIQGGMRVLFYLEKTQISELSELLSRVIQEETETEKDREREEPKESKDREREIPETIEKRLEELEKRFDELEKTLEEIVGILNQMQEEKKLRSKRFVRIETVGNYFQPREEPIKDVYKSGIMFGAELNVGVWESIELWLAQKYFSKKVFDEVSGEDRKISLIPLEGGIKFRFNKGTVNPYLGVGAGYYQYKETDSSGEKKDKKIGYIGLIGCFFKLKGGLIFDVYAHYSYCQVSPLENEFNVGGFHFGVGFGFEY